MCILVRVCLCVRVIYTCYAIFVSQDILQKKNSHKSLPAKETAIEKRHAS